MNVKVNQHKAICEMLSEIYEQKNNDYGDSFGESFKEFGPVAPIVRIDDKIRRLKQLLLTDSKQQVKYESVIDTCLDGANYLIMLAIELRNEEYIKEADSIDV